MRTMPCGHCVVCRKCFVKTIQTAVAERCLPLRCVVCRTKILKLKQQQQQQQQQPVTYHQHHQRHHTPSSTTKSTPGVTSFKSTVATPMANSRVPGAGGNAQTKSQQLAKTTTVSTNCKKYTAAGATTTAMSSTSGHHSQQTSTNTIKTASGSGPGGLQLLSAALGLCGRQTPPVASGQSSATSRSSRPMQPLLIYPADVGGPAPADRWWSRHSAMGWSDDGEIHACGNGDIGQSDEQRVTASPVIVLASNGRRRIKHANNSVTVGN